MSNEILSAERLEAMQLVRDAQLYEGEAQHASDNMTYVVYERGTYFVCDNGEQATTRDSVEAVQFVIENLENAAL